MKKSRGLLKQPSGNGCQPVPHMDAKINEGIRFVFREKAWFQQNHFEAGNGRGAALKRLPAWRRIDETGASQFL
ncbi:MAG TPA: hypothetical protein H9684_01555 [Firmicutes bacterium]|nr:hypothetical protein [Bacillota bacterium]